MFHEGQEIMHEQSRYAEPYEMDMCCVECARPEKPKSSLVEWWSSWYTVEYRTNVVGKGLLHHVAWRGLQSQTWKVEFLRGEKGAKLRQQFQSHQETRELTRSWRYPDEKEMKLKGDTFYRPRFIREEVSNDSSQSLWSSKIETNRGGVH